VSSRRQRHLDEAWVQGLVGQPVVEADRRVVVPEGGAVGGEAAQELAVGVVREALEEAKLELKRVSRPGRRVYSPSAALRPVQRGYGVAILVMIGALVYNLATRTEVQLSIQPVRQPLFVVLSNGDIRNRYQIHITNKSQAVQDYRISVRGIPEEAVDLGEMREVSVRQGKSLMVLANVKLPPAMVSQVSEIEFVITPLKKPGQAVMKKTRFYAKQEG